MLIEALSFLFMPNSNGSMHGYANKNGSLGGKLHFCKSIESVFNAGHKPSHTTETLIGYNVCLLLAIFYITQ